MTKIIDLAVIGAASPAGEAILRLLDEGRFPLGELYVVDADNSEEQYVDFRDDSLPLAELETFDFSKVQLAIFLTGEQTSAEYVSRATQNGCIVIDTSRAFRQDEDVPLVIAGINPELIDDFRQRDLIAIPSSAALQLLTVLKPIDDAVGITSVQVTAMLSVSEAGKRGQEELGRQTISMLNFNEIERDVFPGQIAFNLIPETGPFADGGYSLIELDIIKEAQKILSNGKISISATAIQAPVFYGHSEVVHITTRDAVSADKIGEILDNAPDVIVMQSQYPTPVSCASAEPGVYVGRIREDLDAENGISLWIVADNIRHGIARNSVQVAEILVKGYL
ncbi:MAG: aspartate-semialdehyde dehydrogenase [Gammaproteobacteria bacterium]|nr:aspartate-semialdehyde dehydrogenase [Gammaproteobacteria bacterium]MDH5650810.1 aspartate-semialdehyde dehydrogenase [Gammaproteobacteria bacterium]